MCLYALKYNRLLTKFSDTNFTRLKSVALEKSVYVLRDC